MTQMQHSLPAVETDRLTQQQAGHHPGQQHQMTLVAERAVLTHEADQLRLELGLGIHRGLDWFRSTPIELVPGLPIT